MCRRSRGSSPIGAQNSCASRVQPTQTSPVVPDPESLAVQASLLVSPPIVNTSRARAGKKRKGLRTVICFRFQLDVARYTTPASFSAGAASASGMKGHSKPPRFSCLQKTEGPSSHTKRHTPIIAVPEGDRFLKKFVDSTNTIR